MINGCKIRNSTHSNSCWLDWKCTRVLFWDCISIVCPHRPIQSSKRRIILYKFKTFIQVSYFYIQGSKHLYQLPGCYPTLHIICPIDASSTICSDHSSLSLNFLQTSRGRTLKYWESTLRKYGVKLLVQEFVKLTIFFICTSLMHVKIHIMKTRISLEFLNYILKILNEFCLNIRRMFLK